MNVHPELLRAIFGLCCALMASHYVQTDEMVPFGWLWVGLAVLNLTVAAIRTCRRLLAENPPADESARADDAAEHPADRG